MVLIKKLKIILIIYNIDHTKTNENVGLCKGVNTASEKVNSNYVVYAHDDMYFLPNWDLLSMKRNLNL